MRLEPGVKKVGAVACKPGSRHQIGQGRGGWVSPSYIDDVLSCLTPVIMDG